jgi:hypothetical protein
MLRPHDRRLLPVLAAIAVAALVAAGEGRSEQPRSFTLVNKGKDIHVVSDRDEDIVKFFQRHHVVVGSIVEDADRFTEAKEPLKMVFVSYTSYNDDPAKHALFGAYLTLAPLSPEIAKLVAEPNPQKEGKKRFKGTLILRRDAKDENLYHIVGYMKPTPVGFFSRDKAMPPDDFSPADLRFKAEK